MKTGGLKAIVDNVEIVENSKNSKRKTREKSVLSKVLEQEKISTGK